MTETCPKCGQVVPLYAGRRPVEHIEREATGTSPHSFMMIDDGGWFLHRCVLEDGVWVSGDGLPT